ncbi:MAG TPA: DEAD/DEAH box helicase [Acidimicrobiales bacterium]|nr:DEAD/DEAH box helicase [Acidimicrobiales bacterium]
MQDETTAPSHDTPPTADTPPIADGPETAPGGFAGLGLRTELLKSLASLGYEEPTPIQRKAIPRLLEGRDLLGQAATGTGKTAAFALPALQKIDPEARVEPTILVIVPTRELAVQVSEAMFKYGRELRVRVVPVFGGQPIQRQLRSLDRGAHVVVATPGRAIDHIKRGSLKLDAVRTVVLDEADEMLDMGFTEDIEAILENTPADRQTVLFSATMPSRITAIARRYQNDPVRIQIGAAETSEADAKVRQSVYMVSRHHKASALGRILDIESPQAALVFCRTRVEVDSLTETMNARGYRAEALHGGMDQRQRDRVMGRLRDGSAELLVATDVAARGLDVDTLTHVVNYDVPAAPESYVHRIGRVGRAGRTGVAITLAEPRERRLLRNIERLTRQKITIEKIPSVADLRARQIDQTVEAVREALTAEDLDDYNPVLHALAGDDNLRNVALAAIKLLHESGRGEIDETEIPDAMEKDRADRKKRDRGDRKPHGRGQDRKRTSGPRGRNSGRGGGPDRRERSSSGRSGTGYLYVSLGRKGGVRPADLVGAVANESGLSGREIGPIRILDYYSVVGVPEDQVERVIGAMRNTTVKGRQARVRRYEE